MSRLAIKNVVRTWLGPARLHLDIGCSRLVLHNAKTATTAELPIPLQAGIPPPAAVAGLRAAIVALGAGLPSGKRRLEVTLSDALVRSWIVERLPGLASLQEIEALAGDQMQHLYGDKHAASGEWVIRLDATPGASHWPAIALPKALLDLLIEMATLYDWPLDTIQTRFVRSFNAWRTNPFSRAKFVVYSLDTPDGLSIGIRHRRQWLALRTHPPLALLGTELPTMLRRECRAAGLHLEDGQPQALPWPTMEQAT